MNRIDIEAANLKLALTSILAAYPELAEDEELALDTFEGETNLYEIGSYLIKSIADDDICIVGLDKWFDELSLRKRRFTQKKEAKRKLIKSLMEAGQINKLLLPEATISISKGRSKVVVDDVESLPQGYFKVERKADLTAIKQGIEAGEEIPGARLEIGQDSLAIRTK